MEQSLKDTFLFTSHGLSWNETASSSEGPLPPSLFADRYGTAGCHTASQMLHIHTNHYIPLPRVHLTVILQAVCFDTTS